VSASTGPSSGLTGVSGTAIAAAFAGLLLVWSGIKGAKVTTALRSVLSGKQPAGTNAYPLTAAQATAGTGSGPVAAAGGNPSGGSDAANQALGRLMAAAKGWTGAQWTALNNIVMAESGWSDTVTNPGSGAAGIAQNISGFGPGYESGNAPQQIAWLLSYIKSRYGTPEAAWAFHLANGWY
jgi:hypothetical protein